jgi:dGTPase
VAALADDIAYNNHDLDDGLRARLFTLEEVGALPLVREALAAARAAAPDAPAERLAPEMIRRVINAMVGDVVAESRRRIAALAPGNVDDIRRARHPVIGFSAAMADANLPLRDFLFTRMYRHWRVNRTMAKSKRVVQMLFSHLHGGPQMLPPLWRARAGDAGSAPCALVVCDYIAGMTDRYALEEYRRLNDPDIPG